MNSLLRLCTTVLFVSGIALSQTTPTAAPKPVEPRGPGYKLTPTCATHQTFLSPSLGREMAYCVLLPVGYESSQTRYAVLYLLHGLYGAENDWMGLTKIADYARPLNLIIVMPEGDDSWYTNSATDPRNRYEDYLEKDLITEIESRYRVSSERDLRFIAGLSMGGYGALKAGLRHPENYAAVGAFSSAFGVTRDRFYNDLRTPALAFGSHDHSTREDNDVYFLLSKSTENALPYIFLSAGTDDPLFNDNERIVEEMHLLNVRFENHEMPGKHNWIFWDKSVSMFLNELALRFPALKVSARSH
jgi:putative tributyrin esterase